MIARVLFLVSGVCAVALSILLPNFPWVDAATKLSLLFSVMGAAGLVRLARGFNFPKYDELEFKTAARIAEASTVSVRSTAFFVGIVFLSYLNVVFAGILLEARPETGNLWRAAINIYILWTVVFVIVRFVLVILADIKLHDEQVRELRALVKNDHISNKRSVLERKAFNPITPKGYGGRVNLPFADGND